MHPCLTELADCIGAYQKLSALISKSGITFDRSKFKIYSKDDLTATLVVNKQAELAVDVPGDSLDIETEVDGDSCTILLKVNSQAFDHFAFFDGMERGDWVFACSIVNHLEERQPQAYVVVTLIMDKVEFVSMYYFPLVGYWTISSNKELPNHEVLVHQLRIILSADRLSGSDHDQLSEQGIHDQIQQILNVKVLSFDSGLAVIEALAKFFLLQGVQVN